MASNGDDKYDAALLAILQSEGKVAPFVDVLLGFLYRRTDFFRVMKSDTDKLGFPPGLACKLLMNIFKKYEALAAKDCAKVEELKKQRNEKMKEEAETDVKVEPQMPSAVEIAGKQHQDGSREEKSVRTDAIAAPKTVDTNVAKKAKPAETASGSNTSAGTQDEEEEDPEVARKRRELQANPLTYNGAETDTYFWSQNITETDVRVKVPKFIVKGKQLKVDIQTKHIKVSQQEKEGSWTVLLDNQLSWDINKEESMWTLIPGEFVHLNLEKRQERWWENVFVNEPKINTRKIDCSRPMTDLDEEAQAKIEEMMYNQRQKHLGLPQSHEQKTHEMLRKAWDAEGSPFKGQPFDPSKLNVDPNGMINFNS